MRSRVLLGALFGAIGGFLGYLVQEATTKHDVEAMMLPALDQTKNGLIQGLIMGAFLGIAIGIVEGVAVSSPRLLLRGGILGAVIGGIGGMFGMMFGGRVFDLALFGKPDTYLSQSGGFLDYVHLVIARALGWTFLGALPGLAAGAATFSRKRAMHGLAGGLLGGFVGGIVFDLIGTILGPLLAPAAALSSKQVYGVGGPSRAIGFVAIGLLTGLFIGLVEAWLKQAWVRVLAGRNEGKDYIISKPLTVLGRDERADVPLFGDPVLAPQHAAIKMENGRHTLLDGGAGPGSVVNGQRVQQVLLKDGDMIQLGQMRLLFREKATASKIGKPVVDAPKAAQAPGALAMPSHLCPFCGAAKDAQGNCLCSVPGGAPAGVPQPAPGVPVGAAPYPGAYGSPSPYDSGGYGAPGVSPFPDPAPYGAPGPMPTPMGGPGYGAPALGGSGSQLTGLEGPYAGQVFPLASPNLTLGREPGKDIALTGDTTISRNHAHIAQESGQHVVYDDGSSNGTFVNNVRVQVQTLAPGDIVQFGASKFRYE